MRKSEYGYKKSPKPKSERTKSGGAKQSAYQPVGENPTQTRIKKNMKNSTRQKRVAEYPIHNIFIERWSARAMSGESLSDEELMKLFEAARWAPSSYNGQPWRFIYAKRDTKEWGKFFDLLVPFNQRWAKNAAVLIVVISRKDFEYNNKPARTHSFDTGAAVENLALQGSLDNIVVHGMEGFDYARAQKELNIPDEFTVEAMFAVGRPGAKEDLPTELQEREFPSDRKPLQEIIFEGMFKT